MKTTLETLSTKQVACLSHEAGAAGDLAMVAICQRALGAVGCRHSPREVALAITHARIECVRVINYCEAQLD